MSDFKRKNRIIIEEDKNQLKYKKIIIFNKVSVDTKNKVWYSCLVNVCKKVGLKGGT